MREPLRVCQTTELRPEMRERYLELHAAVWPTVEAGIRAAHIENYSIFVRGNTLVGYFEYVGDDLDADLAVLDDDPDMHLVRRSRAALAAIIAALALGAAACGGSSSDDAVNVASSDEPTGQLSGPRLVMVPSRCWQKTRVRRRPVPSLAGRATG